MELIQNTDASLFCAFVFWEGTSDGSTVNNISPMISYGFVWC